MVVEGFPSHRYSYPEMPERIIDNHLAPNAYISVVQWERVFRNIAVLKWWVEITARVGPNNDYDMLRKTRRANSAGEFVL